MTAIARSVRVLLLGTLLTASWAAHGWDFQTIRAKVQSLYAVDQAALNRLHLWEKLLEDQAGQDIDRQLESVNRFFNRHLRFATDQEIWGESDYWATPVESLIKGAADCEDFTIAKYFSLIRLGIPNEQLRLTYVKALDLGQAHMVLAYYATPESEPLILDNLSNWISPASRRTDLVPVYSFNAAGMWIPGVRQDTSSRPARQLPRWTDVLEKMHSEGFPSPIQPEHED